MKIIALDDGHGMNTPGKRTPVFPKGSGMKSETGNFMHENEFNRAVVKKLDKKLKADGRFKTVLTAPYDNDPSLASRVRVANNANADIFVSIHANAYVSQWGNPNGVETYHMRGSSNGKRLATAIHNELIKGTKQTNRGVKESGFYVLRHTRMPSALVEAGFMDNLREAKLLLSDSFREEVAQEVYVGICKFFGMSPRANKPTPSKPKEEGVIELKMTEKELNKIIDKRVEQRLNTKEPKKHWADKFIDEATKAGILSGYPDGTFRPDNFMTRAEMAVVITHILEKLDK